MIGHFDAVLTNDHNRLLLVLHNQLKLSLLLYFALKVVDQLWVYFLENPYNKRPDSQSENEGEHTVFELFEESFPAVSANNHGGNNKHD